MGPPKPPKPFFIRGWQLCSRNLRLRRHIWSSVMLQQLFLLFAILSCVVMGWFGRIIVFQSTWPCFPMLWPTVLTSPPHSCKISTSILASFTCSSSFLKVPWFPPTPNTCQVVHCPLKLKLPLCVNKCIKVCLHSDLEWIGILSRVYFQPKPSVFRMSSGYIPTLSYIPTGIMLLLKVGETINAEDHMQVGRKSEKSCSIRAHTRDSSAKIMKNPRPSFASFAWFIFHLQCQHIFLQEEDLISVHCK